MNSRVFRLPSMTIALICLSVVSAGKPVFGAGAQLSGELTVFSTLIIDGSPDDPAAADTIPPGRYLATIDTWKRQRFIIKLDSREFGRLEVKISDRDVEIPLTGDGDFSLLPDQHNLPYLIRGEFRVFRSDSETTLSGGSIVCPGGRMSVKVEGYVRSEDVSMEFVDPRSSNVVANFVAVSGDHIDRYRTRGENCVQEQIYQ